MASMADQHAQADCLQKKSAQQDLQQLEEDVIRSLALGHTANACVLAAGTLWEAEAGLETSEAS